MADTNYPVPDQPVYNPNIRALQDSDPARASTIFNPLFTQLIENIHAVKKAADAAQEAAEEAGESAGGAIPAEQKGAPGGLAELDESGHVPSAQLPSYVDDVVEGYYHEGDFYSDLGHQEQITPEAGKIYVDVESNITYRWSGSVYVAIGSDLALGETSSTAYRGDRGKAAYDHSQIVNGNPHGTKASDIGYTDNKKLGATNLQGAMDAAAQKAIDAQKAADAALKAITELAHTIDAIPSQNGSLTYTGSQQSPSWNSYNPETLTLGGQTSGTNAGSTRPRSRPRRGTPGLAAGLRPRPLPGASGGPRLRLFPLRVAA